MRRLKSVRSTILVGVRAGLPNEMCTGGFSEADVAALIVTCVAKVAVMTSYTPGSGDDRNLVTAFETALGGTASLGQKSSFRRFFHESYAVADEDAR